MGLTASVLSGTWLGSSRQQNADSPSLRSSWEFLIHELVQAAPELMHSSSTPSILSQACRATVRSIISFPFPSGVQCQLPFMPPVTSVEGNEKIILYLPSPWSSSFYRWHSYVHLSSWLTSVCLLSAGGHGKKTAYSIRLEKVDISVLLSITKTSKENSFCPEVLWMNVFSWGMKGLNVLEGSFCS